MKKRIFLLGWFLLVILMLNSCVNDVSRLLFNSDNFVGVTDEGLSYEDNIYNVSSSDFEHYTFFKAEGEYISSVFINDGWTWVDIYKVDNQDFGTALRLTNKLLDAKIRTEYVFSENAVIPNIKELEIDNIIIIAEAFSDHKSNYQSMESIISSGWSEVIEVCELQETKQSIALNQIIDFETPIVLEKIDYTMYRECIAFTPKEYTSFYCGIYDVIEHENKLYVKIGDNHELFKIHDEYQELLKQLIIDFKAEMEA